MKKEAFRLQELEIEFRNMLTEQEYQYLIDLFHLKEEDFFEQTNYYLDTRVFALKNKQSALRIRKRSDQFELTLKTPEGKGLLETTQILGSDQAEAILNGSNIPTGSVRDSLEKLGVDYNELEMFGALTTIRAEKDYQDGLLVFDKNLYGGITDFDLEYEVKNYEEGEKVFYKLLEKHEIHQEEAPNKIERFYKHVYQNKDS
ncbi:CYTH domain-containing protein [Listeria valentina]|uniref:CYTH domain-containing protein n=1 Tax=Listeria valentina TaxID=2705293 RepID=UPI001430178E